VLNITIHNQYPGLVLTSPVYFSNGTTCYVSSSQQIDTSNVMEASFGIAFRQENFKFALLYRLQRKHTNTTDNQRDSSTASIENTTNIYILVLWNVDNYDHKFCVCLIECTSDFTWDEDKLWALYREYDEQFYKDYNYRTIPWLIHGDAVMETRREITYESDCKLDIFIYEGTGKYNMSKPVKINPKRLVLLLSKLIMLMYTVSLSIQPSFKLNIHNQCLNVDLISPTYIADKLECHRPPDYKVCVGDTMRSGFIIKSDDMSCGILICRLKRKKAHESTEISEDTSNSACLLVVWEIFRSKGLYADVLLVEHDKGLM
jgi:hypothetical protein